jgi:hypothetical protein
VPDGQSQPDGGVDADAGTDGGSCSTAEPWWDDGYAFRRALSIVAGSTDVPARYSVAVAIDHAALVQAGSSLESGADVRIICNGSQVPRMADPHPRSHWNQAATRIWFDLSQALGADQQDEACYVYYGNPTAVDPPNRWADSMGAGSAAEIFLAGEDFEGHSDGGDPDGWTDQGTDDWVLRSHEDDSWFGPPSGGDWNNGSVGTSMDDVADASWSANLYYWQEGAEGWAGLGARVESSGGGLMVLVQDREGYVATEYWSDPRTGWVERPDIHFPHGSIGRLEIITHGATASAYWHNPAGFTPERVTIVEDWAVGAAAGKVAVFAERPSATNQRWLDVDDIIVRQYIAPEPIVTVGCEQAAP